MNSVYLIGIGGIGMSAVARWFLHEGKLVAGYDRTPTPLTEKLIAEGAKIHYEDNAELIGEQWQDNKNTLVIYTPAVKMGDEIKYFRDNNFKVLKRSEILGELAEGKYVMAVAGTHGKTSITTLIAWLNEKAGGGGQAFLGGISKNFESNLVLGDSLRFAVEADEFDRSFLTLYPNIAVISSVDADHLDIYKTHENLKNTFVQFIGQIKEGGTLIIKQDIELGIENDSISIYRYSLEDSAADFYATNIIGCGNGGYSFDMVCPNQIIENCKLSVGGKVNIENAVAAVAVMWVSGFESDDKIREGLATFRGIKRRFEVHINTPKVVYIDDYAHHPEELRAAITSIKDMFPNRKFTAIFQPHLYSRTQDFYAEFAASLSLVDEVILLPIYPAREEPIEGVSSQMIAQLVTANCRVVEKNKIGDELAKIDTDIVVSFGAGDIDKEVEKIVTVLKNKM